MTMEEITKLVQGTATGEVFGVWIHWYSEP